MLLETGADLDAIKDVIVSKIRIAGSGATFADDAELVLWLQTWKSWGRISEPMQWARALCAAPAGLLKFLRAFRTVARSLGSSPLIKEHEFFVLGNLEEFVDVNVLREETSKLTMSSLTDDEQRIVTLFQKAVNRRDAGHPDYTGLSWED